MYLETLHQETQDWIKSELENPNMDSIIIISGLIGLGFPTHVAYRAVLESLSPELKAQVNLIPDDPSVPWINYTTNDVVLADGHTAKLAVVVRSPEIVLVNEFLTSDECDQMIALTNTTQSFPSETIDQEINRVTNYRKSLNYVPDQSLEIVDRINNRLHLFLNFNGNAESLNITQYNIGDYYKPHTDLLRPGTEPDNPVYKEFNALGQRTVSVLIYLNDVEDGGETEFPFLGYKVYPRKGSALMFYNVDKKFLENDSTMHTGCEVRKGTKYIALKMFRQGKAHERINKET